LHWQCLHVWMYYQCCRWVSNEMQGLPKTKCYIHRV
jgi:hypothetical protein